MSKLFLNDREVIKHKIEVDYIRNMDDYCAYFVSATFADGSEATDAELEALDNKYPEELFEAAMDSAVSAADFMGD